MKTVEIAAATGLLSEYVSQVRKEPLVLTRRGKPVAAVVSIRGMDLETLSLSSNRDFIAIIERARTRYKVEGGISLREMRRKYGFQARRRKIG